MNKNEGADKVDIFGDLGRDTVDVFGDDTIRSTIEGM